MILGQGTKLYHLASQCHFWGGGLLGGIEEKPDNPQLAGINQGSGPSPMEGPGMPFSLSLALARRWLHPELAGIGAVG